MSNLTTAGVVCAMLALSACAHKTEPPASAMATDDDVKMMRSAAKTRMEALGAGDVEKYLSVYQEDAVIIPPHSAEIIGKASAKARLSQALNEVSIEMVSDSREYEILGPHWIAERGRYSWNVTPKTEGEAFMDSGNFMILWHKDPTGGWKISWEMWTSSRPVVETKEKS